jgi:hypothetical protein
VSLAGGRESPSIPLLTRGFLGKQPSQYNVKRLKTGAIPGEGHTAASMGYCRGGGIVRTFSTAATEATQAERKRELRLREINNDLERGNTILRGLRLREVEYLSFSCRYNVGTSVSTMFGEGVITGFRSEDGVYEVLVGWEGDPQEEATGGASDLAKRVIEVGPEPAAAAPGGQAAAATGPEPAAAVEGEEQAEGGTEGRAGVATEAGHLRREGSVDSVGTGAGGWDSRGRLRGGVRMYIAGVAIHPQ